MTFDEYQHQSRVTAVYPDAGKNYVYPSLGLVSEAGEVAGKVKKVLRDEGGVFSAERKDQVAAELGDVLWYIAQIATELGLSVDAIAAQNMEKLLSRMDRGKLSGSGDNR